MFQWLGCQSSESDKNLDATLDLSLADQRQRADQKIFWLLVGQWMFVLAASCVAATEYSEFQFDSLTSLLIGLGALTLLPMWAVQQTPGSQLARWSVVISQGCLSTMLWCVTEGRTETQFQLLAWVFVVAWYQDVKCLIGLCSVALAGDLVAYSAGFVPEFSLEDHSYSNVVSLIGLICETAILGSSIQFERKYLKDKLERDIDTSLTHAQLREELEATTVELVEDRNRLKEEVAAAMNEYAEVEEALSQANRELSSLRREFSRQGVAIVRLASRRDDETLPEDWREDWQTIRREAQKLMRTIDLPSLLPANDESVEFSSTTFTDAMAESIVPSARNRDYEHRALLVCGNSVRTANTETVLNKLGYGVESVSNGPEAYYLTMTKEYDVIMVDVDLPKDEGFDVIEAIRSLPADSYCETIDIFALTNCLTPDRIMRGTAAGVDGILVHPIKEDALRQTLSRSNMSSQSNGFIWTGAGLAR